MKQWMSYGLQLTKEVAHVNVYVYMLNARTPILFDQETKRLLSSISRKEKKSVGELVRHAVNMVYKKSDEDIIKKRMKVVREILELQKKMKPLKGISYRELIEYGRYR